MSENYFADGQAGPFDEHLADAVLAHLRAVAADEGVRVVTKTLLDEGASPGSNLHSWRCEYPDRYGPCTCVEETAREVLTAFLDHLDPARPTGDDA